MKYQLATIIGIDSTLDKILTWSMDGRMNGQPERSMPPADRDRGGIK